MKVSTRGRLEDLACPFWKIDQTWALEYRSFILLPHCALRWPSNSTACTQDDISDIQHVYGLTYSG